MKKFLRNAYGLGALLALQHTPLVFGQTAPAASSESTSAVIVTGTRQTGLKAVDSAAPIQVLDASSLERVGQGDLIQAIAQNIPSFTAQGFGGDTANLTLSARLRGLSPNNTLVLVNGKRRHGTANLAVLGGPYQGGAAADLNFIPVSSIERIEVLQDGAAAQYGTDAIAGVVNIILKKKDSGGTFGVSGGRYFDGGGNTVDGSINFGLQPFEGAFINISGETRQHAHSDRGAIDPRVVDPGNIAAYPVLTTLDGYPYLNHIQGDAKYRQSILSVNSGVDFSGGTQLYAFGTYGAKAAEAFENYRMPSKLPEMYPLGFNPKEAIDETDYAFTFGLKGKVVGDLSYDLSSTYGKDHDNIYTKNSANPDLYADQHRSPTNFYDGKFVASQWTTNLDFSKPIEVGFHAPLNLAFGLEHRKDTYEIGAGEPDSRYKSGASSFPGFLPTDAGKHDRSNNAVYVDVAASPVESLELDAAARFERFSDFGSTQVGKLTGRYDLSPAVGLRGTISSGFRAPTLAEEYYSATNVGPRSAYVQLAPNSAGAKVVGVDGLKPEKSQNLSLGVVLNPSAKLTMTVDGYQIKIKNRIVGSGNICGSGCANNSAAVVEAIKTNGNVLDPSVVQTGINIFSNAVNTRSRGLDMVLSYASSLESMGKVDWSAALNANQTKVIKINQAPKELQPQTLLDAAALSDLETASPKWRLNFGALWRYSSWSINLRENIYGPASEFGTEDGGKYYKTTITTKFTTDLDITKAINKSFSVSIGANNLFNVYPNKYNAGLVKEQRDAGDNAAVAQYANFSPIGINGGYYYAKANFKF